MVLRLGHRNIAAKTRSGLPARAYSRGIRSHSPGGGQRWIVSFGVACAGLLIYLLGSVGIIEGPISYEGLAWAAQVASAVTAWVLLILLAPGHGLRFSNGGFMVLVWATVYLLWPSYELLRGNEFLGSLMQYDRRVAELFIMHAQFFIGFGIPFAILNSHLPVVSIAIKKSWIGYGRAIMGLSLLPVALETFTRVMSGGGLMPNLDYGQTWTNTVDHYSNAMAAGGATRILAQIQSKLWFFVLILQGTAVAFLIVDSIENRMRRIVNSLVIGLFFLALLTLGTGGRSAVLLVAVLGLYISDRIYRPFKWRHIVLVGALIVAVFEFYGYFRAVRTEGFRSAVVESYASLRIGQGRFGEFLFMLPKEERGMELYANSVDPVEYLVAATTNYLPGQIAPWKYTYESTATALSISFRGYDAAAFGSGVAGAIIVDGYRFLGWYGNLVMGVIFAAIFAVVQYWEVREVASGLRYITFYRIMLCGGFAVASFNVVRGDLHQAIGFLVYYVILPHLVLKYVFRDIGYRSRVEVTDVN